MALLPSSGDPMAHFGLGYTLSDLGRFREALPHLRHYTRIAAHGPWNWVWLGRCQSGLAGSSRHGTPTGRRSR